MSSWLCHISHDHVWPQGILAGCLLTKTLARGSGKEISWREGATTVTDSNTDGLQEKLGAPWCTYLRSSCLAAKWSRCYTWIQWLGCSRGAIHKESSWTNVISAMWCAGRGKVCLQEPKILAWDEPVSEVVPELTEIWMYTASIWLIKINRKWQISGCGMIYFPDMGLISYNQGFYHWKC